MRFAHTLARDSELFLLIKEFYHKNPDKALFEQTKFSEASNYFALLDVKDQIVAVSRCTKISDHAVKMENTLVREDRRGRGFGSKLHDEIEEWLIANSYKKILSHVYTDNISSLILKLKKGYLINGLIRNLEAEGTHEYILSKDLK